MSDVLDWSPPWSKPVGELAPMRANGNLPWLTGAARARVLGLEPLNSCIARPPAFPGLELAVPHDATAGIETLVEQHLGIRWPVSSTCRRRTASTPKPCLGQAIHG